MGALLFLDGQLSEEQRVNDRGTSRSRGEERVALTITMKMEEKAEE